MREQIIKISVGRTFQEEERTSAKVLRQDSKTSVVREE